MDVHILSNQHASLLVLFVVVLMCIYYTYIRGKWLSTTAALTVLQLVAVVSVFDSSSVYMPLRCEAPFVSLSEKLYPHCSVLVSPVNELSTMSQLYQLKSQYSIVPLHRALRKVIVNGGHNMCLHTISLFQPYIWV